MTSSRDWLLKPVSVQDVRKKKLSKQFGYLLTVNTLAVARLHGGGMKALKLFSL